MYLLFDIGGTKMRIASSLGEMLDAIEVVPTPQNFEEGMAVFAATARKVLGGKQCVAVAGGFPGPLDAKKQVALGAPNLPGWVKKPLAACITKECAVPVYVQNDAALVGLGEAVYGAGRGFEIVEYVTVSTGVGGARILRGAIDESRVGFEPGHQIIDVDGSILSDNAEPSYLEDMIGGRALERRYGKHPKDIADAAVWETEAKLLAVGLHNMVVHWSPDVIVLGGGMVVAGNGINIERVKQHLKNMLRIFPEPPPVKKAELRDAGGLWGALAYVKSR